MFVIEVSAECPERHADAARLAAELGPLALPAPFALVWTAERLELRKLDEPKLGAVFVDFVEGAVAHRRKFGGGRGQSIAKAVGLKAGPIRWWWMRRRGWDGMPSCWPRSAAGS